MSQEDVETRICRTCGIEKPLTEFHQRNDVKRKGYVYSCKPCKCQKARESYQRNKEKAKIRCSKAAKERILERRKYVFNYLKEHPCLHCGETDPVLLEFDHINPKEKDLPISRAIWNNWSMKRLNAEIDKCQVLCANCHRKKTAEEAGWYKFDDG